MSAALLEECLPAELRGPSTSITRVAAGLSGAGVYRVDADGRSFVLKIAAEGEPLAAWQRKLHVQQLAAGAGLSPAIVHVDEERRAVLSAFVVDRGFPPFWGDPRTRPAALAELARLLRRLHELPLPADAEPRDGRAWLAASWPALAARFPLPTFVGEAVGRVLGEAAPPSERALVLSHNDVNPSNLVYDGERLLMLDWETAGANEPFFDLAAIAVFMRMDDATCLELLTLHDGAPVTALPPRFLWDRRLVAALCGTLFLGLAQQRGHAGAAGDETLASVPSLVDFYQRLRAGTVSPASADGQWLFGLALVKASATL